MTNKKVITFLLIGIFCISLVSAFEWDNKKIYNSETKTATIKNSILGIIPTDTIAEITLLNNTYGCIKNCSAEIMLDLKIPYKNPFGRIDFFNVNSGKLEESNFDNYKIMQRTNSNIIYKPKYTIDCSIKDSRGGCYYVKDGMGEVESWNYREYGKNEILEPGIYYFKINGNKKSNENIEWIPTLFGRSINEWASWNSTFSTNLVSYWNFDESSGTNLEDVSSGVNNGTLSADMTDADWIPGIINNALDFDATNDYVNLSYSSFPTGANARSVSLWVNTTSTDTYLFSYGSASAEQEFSIYIENTNKVCIDLYVNFRCFTANTIANGSWHNLVATYSGGALSSNGKMYQDGVELIQTTINDGTANTVIGQAKINARSQATDDKANMIDEVGLWSRVLTPSEALDLWNDGNGISFPVPADTSINLNITLLYPEDGEILSNNGANFSFNGSISSLSNLNFTNATYNIWYTNGSLFNEISVSLQNSNVTNYTLFINDFTLGRNYLWNTFICYNNDSYSNCSLSDNGNFTFYNLAFTEDNYYYEINPLETNTSSFQLNISTNPSVSSVSGIFLYNGTEYATTISEIDSGEYSALSSFDLPLQEGSGNKTFLWEFTFTLTDSSVIVSNSTIFSHIVNKTILNICNATYSTKFINFTTKSAENPFPQLSSTFKSAWSWWLGSGDVKRNYSYEDVSETNNTWEFCMSPEGGSYNVNSHIETDATNYALNNYFLSQAKLTNVTQNINLYLLNDSKATPTVLKTSDNSQKPIPNVTIQIQLYDVGTDTFYTVSMAKTAFNGESISYLNWYVSLYKMVFTRNGEVVKTVGPYRITESPQKFLIQEDEAFIYDKFLQMAYSLYYNNATGNFVLTFTKPSGQVEMGCLRVVKRDSVLDTAICNVCETSSSATLYCNVGSSGNGTYIATFYATGSYWNFGSIIQNIGGSFSSTIYDILGNDDATFYALMFSGVVLVLMFINLPLGIVGILLGVFGGSALGFQVIDWGAFISMIIVGGVVIWLVKR